MVIHGRPVLLLPKVLSQIYEIIALFLLPSNTIWYLTSFSFSLKIPSVEYSDKLVDECLHVFMFLCPVVGIFWLASALKLISFFHGLEL